MENYTWMSKCVCTNVNLGFSSFTYAYFGVPSLHHEYSVNTLVFVLWLLVPPCYENLKLIVMREILKEGHTETTSGSAPRP